MIRKNLCLLGMIGVENEFFDPLPPESIKKRSEMFIDGRLKCPINMGLILWSCIKPRSGEVVCTRWKIWKSSLPELRKHVGFKDANSNIDQAACFAHLHPY